MSDWAAGYVADIGYTYGYYNELNPLRADLPFLSRGLVPPAPGTHCELGFGQGMSVNLHAAAAGSRWYGTDFNPAQAGFAQSLAAASGADVHLYDQSFEEFCARTDLPDFDSIGLHGIWSWISDENRSIIVDFVRRKLKVGGVLYISYNTQPGWTAMVPLRDLLTEHAEVMAAPGRGIVSRIDAALEFAEELLATSPTYARINPQVQERLEMLKGQNRNYLAHEYFNRDWLPMLFSRMADWLARGKVDFACSANYFDYVEALHLTSDQQQLLNKIPDPVFRETVRDFCVNQQFRRDYWVKGARRLSALEQAEALRGQGVILVQPRADVSLTVKGNVGEATLQAEVYGPLLDLLADYEPKTLAELEKALSGRLSFQQITQAVMVLIGAGSLMSVQNNKRQSQAKPFTDRLNAHLRDLSRGSNDLAYLASPVTGGGISVNRFCQLFLLAREQGKSQPGEWAAFAWSLLAAQGHGLLKEGKALSTPEENLAELTAQATTFAEKQLPILKALQIA